MTKTPRDWKKDMEMCKAVKDSKWLTLESSATAVWQRGGLMSTIWKGPDAEALQEHKDALPYWLQEAKELQQLLGDEQQSHTNTLEREQRLKETVETAIQLYDMGESSNVYPLLKDILRTLYPDTPAPKEGDQ